MVVLCVGSGRLGEKLWLFPVGGGFKGDLSLDVTDFVGSSVLRAFGECLGAQRR